MRAKVLNTNFPLFEIYLRFSYDVHMQVNFVIFEFFQTHIQIFENFSQPFAHSIVEPLNMQIVTSARPSQKECSKYDIKLDLVVRLQF